MRRLKDLLEHGGVKVLAPQDVLFARLLDLDDNGDDEEEKDDAAGDADDGAVCVVQVVQDVGFRVLCAGAEALLIRVSHQGSRFRHSPSK